MRKGKWKGEEKREGKEMGFCVDDEKKKIIKGLIS